MRSIWEERLERATSAIAASSRERRSESPPRERERRLTPPRSPPRSPPTRRSSETSQGVGAFLSSTATGRHIERQKRHLRSVTEALQKLFADIGEVSDADSTASISSSEDQDNDRDSCWRRAVEREIASLYRSQAKTLQLVYRAVAGRNGNGQIGVPCSPQAQVQRAPTEQLAEPSEKQQAPAAAPAPSPTKAPSIVDGTDTLCKGLGLPGQRPLASPQRSRPSAPPATSPAAPPAAPATSAASPGKGGGDAQSPTDVTSTTGGDTLGSAKLGSCVHLSVAHQGTSTNFPLSETAASLSPRDTGVSDE